MWRLTSRTIVRRPATLDDALDRGATAATRPALAIVDVEASAGEPSIPSARRALDHRADRREQSASRREVERRRQGTRIDFRTPERFGRIDVAESSDHALVEQRDFDRNATARKRSVQHCRCEPRIERLRTQIERQVDARCVDVDRRQRARVIQHDTHFWIEMENGPGEARHRVRRRANDPVSVHPEVDVQDATILEVNELMLPAPLDRAHPRTGQRSECAAGETPPQRRVQRAGTAQRSPFDRRAEESRGAFDFGKLGHELSR